MKIYINTYRMTVATWIAAAVWMSACGDKPREQRVGIQVVAATYGENCHAEHGNSTKFVAAACDWKTVCAYTVDVNKIGDPTPGCAKDFLAEWTCSGSATVEKAKAVVAAGTEAGFGSIVTLRCEGRP